MHACVCVCVCVYICARVCQAFYSKSYLPIFVSIYLFTSCYREWDDDIIEALNDTSLHTVRSWAIPGVVSTPHVGVRICTCVYLTSDKHKSTIIQHFKSTNSFLWIFCMCWMCVVYFIALDVHFRTYILCSYTCVFVHNNLCYSVSLTFVGWSTSASE